MRETETEDERERQRGEKNREGEGRKRDSHKRLKNHRIKQPVSVCNSIDIQTRTVIYGRGAFLQRQSLVNSAGFSEHLKFIQQVSKHNVGLRPTHISLSGMQGFFHCSKVGEVLYPILVTLRSLPSYVIHGKVFLWKKKKKKIHLTVCGEMSA